MNNTILKFAITQQEVQALCFLTRMSLSGQPMLLQLKPPVNICGDIHGQYRNLLHLFQLMGSPSSTNYLFLGDYVDRGKRSLECFCLLMAYKIKYPNNFFLLRGNHQCSQVNKIYGFYDQCKRKFNIKLWKSICDTFDYLPIAAVVGDRIFCVHGGLSPQIKNIRDLNSIKRPMQPIRNTVICDMLWSDPNPLLQGWNQNIDRGVSYYFGANIINLFLQKYDFDLICRSHQVVQQGYQFFNQRKLLTIFSAPNYCGQYDNIAAVLKVDQEMKCSIQQFQDTNCKEIFTKKRSITPIPKKRVNNDITRLKKDQDQDKNQNNKNVSQNSNQQINQLKHNNDTNNCKKVRKLTNANMLQQQLITLKYKFSQTFDEQQQDQQKIFNSII